MEVPLTRFQEIMYEKSIHSMPSSRRPHVAACMKVRGPLDSSAFERAAASLVQRHPVLRARLAGKSGSYTQYYGDSSASFEVIDVAPDEDLAAAALAAKADEAIDLYRENPFKVVLGRARSDTAFVLLAAHHVFVDDLALQQLLAEYTELLVNPSRACSEEPVPWDSGDSSFFAWCTAQERMSRDGTFERNERYWVNHLRGADPALRLPGRPPDPEFQNLAAVESGLTPAEMQASLSRAARLRVSHSALVVSTVFHELSQRTLQDNLTFTIIHDARRPPFSRTIGQFAESFLLKQPERHEGALADRQIRRTYFDIINASLKYVSYAHFADELPWLAERRDKDFSATDVRVNYISRTADFGHGQESRLEVTQVPLAATIKPLQSPYYGVVMSFTFRPVQDYLYAHAQYDSSLIERQLTKEIMSSVLDQLGRAPDRI